MPSRGNDHHESGAVSMKDLLHQIETNKKHYQAVEAGLESPRKGSPYAVRSTPGSPDGTSSSNESEGATITMSLLPPGTPTSMPLVRELDVDADTFMFLCLPFPVLRMRAIRRRVRTWFTDLMWPRPPLPCVTTTCGPIFHVRSCQYHPLSGGLPYEQPIRRAISFPGRSAEKVRRTVSLPTMDSSGNGARNRARNRGSPSSLAPSDTSSEESAGKPAEQPAEEPVEEPAQVPAEEPAEEPAESSADEPAELPAEVSAEEPAEK